MGTNVPMTSDSQDQAESLDEDVVGGYDSAVTSDQVEPNYPPDELEGVPFADADVTDESLIERIERQTPEVWEKSIRNPDLDDDSAADERLEQIVDLGRQGDDQDLAGGSSRMRPSAPRS
jgi:hypothetical protein